MKNYKKYEELEIPILKIDVSKIVINYNDIGLCIVDKKPDELFDNILDCSGIHCSYCIFGIRNLDITKKWYNKELREEKLKRIVYEKSDERT